MDVVGYDVCCDTHLRVWLDVPISRITTRLVSCLLSTIQVLDPFPIHLRLGRSTTLRDDGWLCDHSLLIHNPLYEFYLSYFFPIFFVQGIQRRERFLNTRERGNRSRLFRRPLNFDCVTLFVHQHDVTQNNKKHEQT